ncbi:DEAD/DEAH box helicase [Dactylosporangium matsuzakiense]|uniref:Helicase HelZ n=1 Tax=Dactylosporangium matsuzakiense TaxID=53360 RepID=A0A9W6KPS4_9ACTN|nr:DEAD/DEAH box helicase [Dactylosporangium matsuzakiense]GLL04175.1 helicase HelZ [Dactylosporangium matsuzakiense]
MLVVHALWVDGRVALWASDGDTLLAGLNLNGDTGVAAERILLLPTRNRKLEPWPAVTEKAALKPWTVGTVEYEPDEALRLLPGLCQLIGDDITLAQSTEWFVALAEFACALVARGRMLPAIVDGRPRWAPVLTGRDAAHARAVALALPSAAVLGMARAAVVTEALDAFVDAAARADLPAEAQTWLDSIAGVPPQRLTAWEADAVGGAVRACFRLVEPPEPKIGEEPAPDPHWTLEFALQAADEPTLVVDADRVWRSRGALKALQRHIPAPQETLLAELGRASRLYPALEDALREARPAALPLDTDGAHRLLSEGAPLLAAAGFGVVLPGWWRKASARLGARLKIKDGSGGTAPGTVNTDSGLGLGAVVDYDWELALGDEPLTEDELRRLTDLKTPLVRLRGQWVELDPRRLAEGLSFLERQRDAEAMTVADLLHLAGGAEEGPGGLPIVEVVADGWLGDLLSGEADLRLDDTDAPSEFRGELRPYQRRGLNWLRFLERAGLGGILADDMGLGKTVQLLALLAGPAPGPTLLVCPMSLVGNWQREAAKFAPSLRVHVHHGADRVRSLDPSAFDLVVTTYSVAARDTGVLGAVPWHRVVLDEAQAVKNAATKQASAVRQLPSRHRIAVTGTPVENRLADLWSIMEFANPGLLGSATKFKERFAEPIERDGDADAAARLRRITQPFVLRRVKTDRTIISDLPEKLEMDVVCSLTPEQASLYQAVVEDMLARIESSEGIERRGLVLATMTRLKQICNHPALALRDGSRLPGRSGKLARLEEITEEVLAAGERALIFTQYAEFGRMLRTSLATRFGREVAFLHGGVQKAARDAMVARFQEAAPSSPPLFVLSLKAGGTGLTLTAANHVIHADRWWNPAVEDQATDRAFRIGQRRAVQVRKFVTAGTVEEKIAALITDKRGLAQKIVGTGEQWLTELSTADLRTLLTLDPAAAVSP